MVPTAAASAAVPKLGEIDTASELVRHALKRADFLIKEATVSPAVKCKTLGSKTSTGSGGKKGNSGPTRRRTAGLTRHSVTFLIGFRLRGIQSAYLL